MSARPKTTSGRRRPRALRAAAGPLVAALLCAVLAATAAGAAAHGAKPRPKPKVAVTAAQVQQIESLEGLVGTLSGQLADLEKRSAAVAARTPEPAVPPPSTLPFSGPAGGVLTGSYPNPGLAPGTVGPEQLAFGSVTGSTVANRSLTGADLAFQRLTGENVADRMLGAVDFAPGSIEGRLFGGQLEYGGDTVETTETIKPDRESKVIALECPGEDKLMAAGWRWSDENGDGTVVLESHPHEVPLEGVTRSWLFRAAVQYGGTTNTFEPQVLCLKYE